MTVLEPVGMKSSTFNPYLFQLPRLMRLIEKEANLGMIVMKYSRNESLRKFCPNGILVSVFS
jgi:hypothetical protein